MELAARKVRHLVADVAVDDVASVQGVLFQLLGPRERHPDVVSNGLHHVVVGLAFLNERGNVGALQRVLRPALRLADEHQLRGLGPVVLRVGHRDLSHEYRRHVLVGIARPEDDRAAAGHYFLDGVIVRVVNREGGVVLVVLRGTGDVELVVQIVHEIALLLSLRVGADIFLCCVLENADEQLHLAFKRHRRPPIRHGCRKPGASRSRGCRRL